MKQDMPNTVANVVDYHDAQQIADDFNEVFGETFKPLKTYEIGVHEDDCIVYFLFYTGKRPSKTEIAKLLKARYNLDIQDLIR